MAEAPDAHLSDKRRLPFCYQTHDALDAIRALYADGEGYGKLAVAIAVYVVLTEAANRQGGQDARNAFRAQRKQLAAMVGVSKDSLDRYVAVLVAAGVVEVEKQRAGDVSLPNIWHLVEGGVDAPPSRADAATPAAPTRPFARVPSSGKEVEPKTHPPVVPPAKPHGKVDGKPVTEAEHELGSSVLAAFNELAGTRYTAASWLGKVVLRCREVPDLDVAGHRHVIEAALADPWWKGGASPSVIYGNAALFERCLHLAAAPGDERPLTPDEIGTYGILWGPGTGYDSLAAARRAQGDAIELDDADVVDLDP